MIIGLLQNGRETTSNRTASIALESFQFSADTTIVDLAAIAFAMVAPYSSLCLVLDMPKQEFVNIAAVHAI
jgi:hypothetical protein